MGDEDTVDKLRAIARRRHVHFDVRPELEMVGDARVKVGFELRVWTVHDRSAHAMPGCSMCRELLVELDQIVQWAIPPDEGPTRVEVEHPGSILYDSREVPGTDEVAITVRLTQREDGASPVDAFVERGLHQIRERLRVLGVPER
jgi:hypothetical protein